MTASTVNALAELCLDGREEDESPVADVEGISLDVTIDGLPFSFYVGSGTQDLKWLTLVAAERYLRLVKQNAKIRKYKEVLSMGRFIPSTVRIDGELSQRPSLKLNTLVGRRIEISLAQEIECSAYGLPKLTPWMTAAYMEDRSSRKVFKRRSSLRQMDVPRSAELVEPNFDSQDQSEMLSKEFQITWLHLEGFRAHLFDKGMAGGDANSEEHFREVVLRNFPFIRTLFEHYAWFGRGGRPELFMTFAEVCHCVHSTQVLNMSGSQPKHIALVEFYAAVCINEMEATTTFREDVEYSWDNMDQWTLDRSQFLECLLWLIAHQSTEDQLIKDLNDILSTTVAPASKALSTTKLTSLRQVLREPLGYKLFQEKYKQLNWLFTQFMTGRASVANALSLQEFALVLKELDETYNENKEDEGDSEILELYQKCTETFGLVQTLSIKVGVLSEVVLIEFIEALVVMLCRGTAQDLKDKAYAQQAYTNVLSKVDKYVSQYMEEEDEAEGKEEKEELVKQ